MNPKSSHVFSPRGILAQMLLILMLIPSSWGCALFRDPVPPGFDTVSIQAEVNRNKESQIKGDLTAMTTLKGALIGAVFGAPTLAVAAGGGAFLISSTACLATAATLALAFFAYPVCVILWTGGFFIGGFIVGLGGGAAMGIIGGLPKETATDITEVLARLEDNRSFDDEILSAMQAAIPAEKQVDPSNAPAVVTHRLRKFDLRQHSKDHISIRLWASMEQEWKDEGGKPKKNTCNYRLDSDRRPAETWLADGGVAFREAVNETIKTFSAWMNSDLEAFATETEFKKTDDSPRSCFHEKHWYSFMLYY